MKNNLEFKPSPIGPIPSDWKIKELSEIVDKKRPISYGIVQTGEPVTDGVKCIRVMDLVDGKINSDNLITTSKKISDGYKRTILRKGDLVLALRGKIGEIAIVEENLIGSNLTRGVALIATNESIDNEFLKQQIASPRTRIVFEKNLNGSALQEISIGVLRKIPVVLPNLLEEQIAISAALLTWDKAVEKTTQLITAKEQRKKWLMHQLLTGKKRLKGFNKTWPIKTIGSFAKTTAGGTPSTLNKNYWGGSIRWMNSGELNFKFVYEVEGRITKEGLKNSSTKMLPAKCVMIGLAGQGKTRGTVAMNMIELCANQSIAAVLPNNYFIAEYLFFNLDNRYDELRKLSTGDGGRGGLNLNIINSVKIPLPSITEQNAIVNILQTADKEINLLKQKLGAYKEQKKGLMQVLLTGKVRVKI